MEFVFVISSMIIALLLYQLVVRVLIRKKLLNLKGIVIVSIVAGLEAALLTLTLSYIDASFEAWSFYQRLALGSKIFGVVMIGAVILLVVIFSINRLTE